MNLLTLIIPLTVLLFVIIGAIGGLKNGIKKQSIKLGFLVLTLLLSIFITGLVSNVLIATCANMSPEELIELFDTVGYKVTDDVIDQISGNTAALAMLLAVPVAFIVAPIVFLIVYGILKLITIIPYNIITKSIQVKKEKKSGLNRLLGAAIGAVYGLLLVVIIASPFTGIMSLVTDSAEAIASSDSEQFEDISKAVEIIPEDPTLNFLGAVGGNLIYESLATVEVNGESYNMKSELATPLVKLIANASKLEDIEDFTKLSKEEQETLTAVVAIFEESPYISDICSNVLLIASDSLKESVVVREDGELVENAEVGAAFQNFIDSFFNVITTIANDSLSGKTSLTTDLNTLLSVYFTLSDYDVISTISNDPEYAVDRLMAVAEIDDSGKKITVMSKVVNTLNANEHTRSMVTVLSQISVTALAGQFDVEGDIDITKVYNDVKTSVSAIASVDREIGETEYVAEVSTILNDALIGNDLDIETEVIDQMAQYIYDNPDTVNIADEDGNGELTDEEMNSIILTYYDVYVEYNASGEIPEDFPGDDLIPDDYID